MRAVVLSDGLLEEKDCMTPRPKSGEALIKIIMAGICNTDLELIKGYMGFEGILGHEFVGEVVEASDDKWVGRRVVGEINIGCGVCEYCLKDRKEHCMDREVLGIYKRDGVFAQYTVLPLKNLLVVPDEISDEQAVLIEPLAAVLRIFDQIKIKPSDKVALLGDGKLGLLVAKVFKNIDIDRFVVFGHHLSKLNLIPFAETFLQIEDSHLKQFDYLIDSTGSHIGFEQAISLLKPEGTLVLKSTVAQEHKLSLAPVVIDEIKIVGSRCGRFAFAIELLKSDKIDLSDMITSIYKFSDWKHAFEAARKRDSLKILIDVCSTD